MHHAWIDGTPAELDAAAATAARLLDASRQPLVAGLGTDVAGARAAIVLAQRIGAVIDHMNADALLRDLDVLREAGLMLTTPSETSLRADTLLLVGPGMTEASSALPAHLRGAASGGGDGGRIDRRIFWLCPGRHAGAPRNSTRSRSKCYAASSPTSTQRRVFRGFRSRPPTTPSASCRSAGGSLGFRRAPG